MTDKNAHSMLPPMSGGDTSPTGDIRDSVVHAPSQIGDYQILGVLGKGGMGVVYRAEQSNPKREVALKVLRPGLTSVSSIRRFEHEAEALGRLRHSAIAQIYFAGTTDTGNGEQPFFAMELVQGKSLTAFADSEELEPKARLDLVAKLCDAVHHAHQKGVIHRDLKPANILVDASGQPKILDFGVARVTESDVRWTSVQTGEGELLGTVPYMSPEQAAGLSKDLDIRSDVYTLGVILHELLSGRLPYDFDGRQLLERLRVIERDDPIPLRETNREFRGDLDTIVAKALEKDKTRRYQSAAELGADIRRYLADEPITARPASTWYQFTKFARRNRVLLGGLAATFLSLILGTVVTTTLWLRVRQASAKDKVEMAEKDAERGRWTDALRNYARAREAGFPDQDTLRLKEAVAKLNLNRIEAARSDLLTLTKQEDTRYATEATFWLGVAEIGRNNQLGCELLTRAVDMGGLDDSLNAFAEAMLAPDTRTSVDHLRKVVRQDPYLHHAYHMLVYMLILLGEREDASVEMRVAERRFPDDPNLKLLKAIYLASENRLSDAKEAIEDFGKQAGKEQVGILMPIVELIGLAAETFETSVTDADSRRDRLSELATSLGRLLPALTSRSGADDEFLVAANPPPLARLYSMLLPMLKQTAVESVPGAQSLSRLKGFFSERATDLIGEGATGILAGSTFGGLLSSPNSATQDTLDQAIATHREGTLLFFRGLLSKRRGAWQEAERDFALAAEVPAFLPVRKRALREAIEAQYQLAEIYGQAPNELMKTKCAASIRRLFVLVEADAPEKFAASLPEYLANKAWELGEHDLGRSIISHYERNHSLTVGLAYLRAGIDYKSRAYFPALAATRKGLLMNPAGDVKTSLEWLQNHLPECIRREADEVAQGVTPSTELSTDEGN